MIHALSKRFGTNGRLACPRWAMDQTQPPNPDGATVVPGLLSDLGASNTDRENLNRAVQEDPALGIELAWACETCMTDNSLPFLRAFLELLRKPECAPQAAIREAMSDTLGRPGMRGVQR